MPQASMTIQSFTLSKFFHPFLTDGPLLLRRGGLRFLGGRGASDHCTSQDDSWDDQQTMSFKHFFFELL
jgi:hypothetical protein